ncbi:MAG: malate dehydrogenase [Polyangiales bacterium]
MAKRNKIGLIGAGNIGGELAAMIARRQLGDVVLFDIPSKTDFAKGKALDLNQNSAILGYDANIVGTSDWADCAGCDVLIITAGVPRKPGQSRDDLVGINLPIIKNVALGAKEHCPDAFVIVISNPLDVMVWAFTEYTGWDPKKIAGMAGVLDSARLQYFLAAEAGVSVKDVRAMVLGGHGDDMVPVRGYCTINGVPVSQVIPSERLDAIETRTRGGGGEIVKLMGTSAYYAPASAAIEMAEAYLKDQKRLLPAAAHLTGQYGYNDMFLGVPVIIGGGGVEKIVEISLTDAEKGMLAKSVASVTGVVDVAKRLSAQSA